MSDLFVQSNTFTLGYTLAGHHISDSLRVNPLVHPQIIIVIIIITGPCLPVRSGRGQSVCGGRCHGGRGGGICEKEASEVCSQREDPDLPDKHDAVVSQEHEEEGGRGGGGEGHLHQDQRYLSGFVLKLTPSTLNVLFLYFFFVYFDQEGFCNFIL